jgi:hypothetical protein
MIVGARTQLVWTSGVKTAVETRRGWGFYESNEVNSMEDLHRHTQTQQEYRVVGEIY